jgi:hypothetical protein
MARSLGSVTDPDVVYINSLKKLLKIRVRLLVEKRKAKRISDAHDKRIAKKSGQNDEARDVLKKAEQYQERKKLIEDQASLLRWQAEQLVADLDGAHFLGMGLPEASGDVIMGTGKSGIQVDLNVGGSVAFMGLPEASGDVTMGTGKSGIHLANSSAGSSTDVLPLATTEAQASIDGVTTASSSAGSSNDVVPRETAQPTKPPTKSFIRRKVHEAF